MGLDRLIVVAIAYKYDSEEEVVGVDYNGLALTGKFAYVGTSVAMATFYAANPDVGTHEVAITMTAQTDAIVTITTYTGIMQGGQVYFETYGVGTALTEITILVEKSIGDIVLIHAVSDTNLSTIDVAAEQTQLWNIVNGTSFRTQGILFEPSASETIPLPNVFSAAENWGVTLLGISAP